MSAFSTDRRQNFLIVPDATNQRIYVVARKPLGVVAAFGQAGRWAGRFCGAHNIAANSHGDRFLTETYEGNRVQTFRHRGLATPRQR